MREDPTTLLVGQGVRYFSQHTHPLVYGYRGAWGAKDAYKAASKHDGKEKKSITCMDVYSRKGR